MHSLKDSAGSSACSFEGVLITGAYSDDETAGTENAYN